MLLTQKSTFFKIKITLCPQNYNLAKRINLIYIVFNIFIPRITHDLLFVSYLFFKNREYMKSLVLLTT